jgi:hypothetical protein
VSRAFAGTFLRRQAELCFDHGRQNSFKLGVGQRRPPEFALPELRASARGGKTLAIWQWFFKHRTPRQLRGKTLHPGFLGGQKKGQWSTASAQAIPGSNTDQFAIQVPKVGGPRQPRKAAAAPSDPCKSVKSVVSTAAFRLSRQLGGKKMRLPWPDPEPTAEVARGEFGSEPRKCTE